MGQIRVSTEEYEAGIIAMVYGIPMEWFRQIDKACDVFFAKLGMPQERFNLQHKIFSEMRLGRIKREAKNGNATNGAQKKL